MTENNSTAYAEALIALGEHLKQHPQLPRIYAVLGRSDDGACSVRLLVGNAGKAEAPVWLAAWAATMTDIESHAYRFGEDSVDGHVRGLLGGVLFDVHGSLEPECFPVENGQHAWDVTALLQEA